MSDAEQTETVTCIICLMFHGELYGSQKGIVCITFGPSINASGNRRARNTCTVEWSYS
jgi:hypothetical protein